MATNIWVGYDPETLQVSLMRVVQGGAPQFFLMTPEEARAANAQLSALLDLSPESVRIDETVDPLGKDAALGGDGGAKHRRLHGGA